MSTAAAVQPRMTLEEFLAFERTSDVKHDFVNGVPITLAGGTEAHNTIAGNVFATLHGALRGQPCKAYNSDMKVQIPATGGTRYPDVSVAGAPTFNEARDVLVNPCAIVEVLSPSTEAEDRGKKFHEYRSIPSFQEYVLISQHRVLVEHYTRQPDGKWTLEILPAGETLRLSCAPVEIAVQDLYEGVEFPPQ